MVLAWMDMLLVNSMQDPSYVEQPVFIKINEDQKSSKGLYDQETKSTNPPLKRKHTGMSRALQEDEWGE